MESSASLRGPDLLHAVSSGLWCHARNSLTPAEAATKQSVWVFMNRLTHVQLDKVRTHTTGHPDKRGGVRAVCALCAPPRVRPVFEPPS